MIGRALIAVLAVAALAPASASAAPATVTSAADSGAGSLRAAVAAANAGDTIEISPEIDTIKLTSGQIPVTKTLTIKGSPDTVTAISGNDTSRVFCVQAPACGMTPNGPQPSLTLSDLEVIHGKVTTTSDFDGG